MRVTEASLDADVLGLFARMKVLDEKIHAWVVKVLRKISERSGDARKAERAQVRGSLKRVENPDLLTYPPAEMSG